MVGLAQTASYNKKPPHWRLGVRITKVQGVLCHWLMFWYTHTQRTMHACGGRSWVRVSMTLCITSCLIGLTHRSVLQILLQK